MNGVTISKYELRRLYIDEVMSILDISKECGITQYRVYNLLHYYHIPVRSVKDSHNTIRAKAKIRDGFLSRKNRKIRATKDEILYQYVTLQKTDKEIAELYDVDNSNVTRLRQKYNIPAHSLSEASRQRLSLVSKGHNRHTKQQREILIKRMAGNRLGVGRKPTDESRKKRSVSIKRAYESNPSYREKLVELHMGANNPQWRGGRSLEPYTREFNKQLKIFIRMRDGYTCQLCGMSENENMRALACHHIDYNKENTMPNNLIALCKSCHTKTNSNRKYWKLYFSELLNKRQLHPKALLKSKTQNIKGRVDSSLNQPFKLPKILVRGNEIDALSLL